MIERIKRNRLLLILLLGGLVLLLIVGLSLWNQSVTKKTLEEEHASLLSELNAVENTIAERQASIDVEKLASVEKATGLDPSLVVTDEESAKAYFEPAFNWKTSAEYESARNQYMESLGEGNSFTETYLPRDTVIDTNDGPLSYIDFKSIQASMGDIHIVPLRAEGNRIRYVAFVSYFMHQDASDMVNPEALEQSEAIIEFTAAGDVGKRHVTEVNASPGFRSSSQSAL